MTILKELLYTISSLPQIVNVSSTNTPNENIDTKNLEKLLSFINAQEGTINKIVNGKGLYQKRFETLTLEEKKNFFKEVMRNSATTKEQKNIIEEKLKDDKFVNEHLDSFFDSTIQNIIRAKSNENKSKKQLKNDLKEKKRLETDPEHYINDSSEVSSKKIYAELKQLEGILKEYEIILKPLLKKIEMIEIFLNDNITDNTMFKSTDSQLFKEKSREYLDYQYDIRKLTKSLRSSQNYNYSDN